MKRTNRWHTVAVCLLLSTILLSLVAPLKGQSFEVLKIDADTAKGFSWPYFLAVPVQPARPIFLLVEPNNTGTVSDDQNVHETSARNLINSRVSDAGLVRLGCPILIPVFPRPLTNWTMYTQALDRDTLLTKVPGLVRIDLQFIAMIDDARGRLAARGLFADSRVLMWGYSASGTFTNRFCLLHPDRVKVAIYGGNTFPVLPVAEYAGQRLRYPIGVADLQELTGSPFDLEGFRRLPMEIFRGEEDTNDEVAYSDGYDAEDRTLINSLFGGPPPLLRYPAIEGLYRSVQANTRFVIDAGVGHAYGSMYAEMLRLFDVSRADPPPALPAKPMAFKMYFPHIACSEGWSTEIGIVNTMEMVPLNTQISGYSAQGGSPLLTLSSEVPAGGRRQIPACSELPQGQQIAYLAVTTDAPFQGGYTKFFRSGNRVSLAASKGSRSGVLAKMEKQGWTGIALLNTEDAPASIVLRAYDDWGAELASVSVRLPAKARIAGTPEALFGGMLPAATHFRFRSDRVVIAFALNGSGDETMLDGLPALAGYLR